MSFLLTFNALLVFCLFWYNLWCWLIAATGMTTIEFMSKNSGFKYNQYDFAFARSRDNLFKVFGTKSYFSLLSPSMRYSPFNGIEWSFSMKDLGFNEFGELASGSKSGIADEENTKFAKKSSG